MRRWLFLLLASACFAQTQGNAPYVVQVGSSASVAQPAPNIVMPNSVTSGNTLIGCFGAGVGDNVAPTDSQGNTWTITSATQTPAPHSTYIVYMGYTTASATGALTVNYTAGSSTLKYAFIAEVKNLGAVDGSVATQTHAALTGTGTIATSTTTTVNGDLLVSCNVSGIQGTSFSSPGADSEYPGFTPTASPGNNTLMTFKRTNALGSYTSTINLYSDTGDTFAMETLAFKPDAIKVADTKMPDAAVGIAYSAQLHGIGGIAGLTYACTGLPANGFSLNTGTGVITASNPTLTTSIGCTVTDGSTTSATNTLSLPVGAAFKVPFVRQINDSWSGDNGGTSFSFNLLCGSYVIVVARGDNTHGSPGAGWVQAASGANNYIKDSLNSPVRRIFPGPGTGPWPNVIYAIGPVSISGADTITIANNQTASSGLKVNLAFELTGGQLIDDDGAWTNYLTSSSSGTFNLNYTTVVPNTLLLSFIDAVAQAGVFPTESVAAPYSAIPAGSGNGKVLYATATIGSAGLVTTTHTYSGAATPFERWAQAVIPIRPALAVAGCPANLSGGEKIRRQIY